MEHPDATDPDATVRLTLDAVIIAVSDHQPRILLIDRDPSRPGLPGLPSGPLAREHDTTLELGIRRLIRDQAGLGVGYVEQLYTFGDRDRGTGPGLHRHLSVAYLALVLEHRAAATTRWVDLYDLLPWEDTRPSALAAGTGDLTAELRAELDRWAGDDPDRRERIAVTFGPPWDGIRALERFELLYGAGLVADLGQPLASDHRRIAATALGRIRGKLTYRPVVFELLPPTFRLLELQHTVEALAGVELHKQNFRRLVERSGLVEGTGERTSGTAGRPAELFRYRPSVQLERPRPGVGVPYR